MEPKFQRHQQKSFTCMKTTPVLLVCVYNKNGTLITHDIYYRLFSQYGKVLRILIFQKAKVWKTFVEMESEQVAQAAKIHLNNKVLFEDGSRMNIYFSNLQSINFQNCNTGGVDYSLINANIQLVKEAQQSSSDPSQLSPDKYMLTADFQHSLNKLDEILFVKDSSQRQLQSPDEETKVIQSNIQAKLSLQELMQSTQSNLELIRLTNDNDPNTYVNPKFLMENVKSRVMYIRGLENGNLKIEWLMNLLLNFGNVIKLIFIRDKKSALVEFENIDFSTQAKDFLNNTKFMGNTLKIFYSNYQSLSQRNPQFGQYEEVMEGDPAKYRYKQKKHNTEQGFSINPPSQILHISNLKQEACKDQIIGGLFSPFGQILDIKFIVKDQIKYMALVKFDTMEHAFSAMVQMQGFNLNGRNIQISFTRSKLN